MTGRAAGASGSSSGGSPTDWRSRIPAGSHGFSTRILLLPVEKLGVAVFTNTNVDAEALALGAVELLIPVLDRVRERLTPADTASPPANWERYAGICEHSIGPDIEIKLAGTQLVLGSPEAPQAPGEPLATEGPHRFRMQDSTVTGEPVIFELGAARVRVRPYVYHRKP